MNARTAARSLLLVALAACEFPGDTSVQPATGTTTGATAVGMPYLYVLVRDRESTDTGGMELDAVELVKGGSSYFADEFHEYIQGPGIENVTVTRDANQALGPPNNAVGDCESSDTFFVSLGGVGGSMVFSFGGLTEIETGDVIRVYECGAVADVYSIFVGVADTESDPNWVTCVSNASGVAQCNVPTLPDVPLPTTP